MNSFKTCAFIGSTLCLMIFLELPKFAYFTRSEITHQPYEAFPWAAVKHACKSSPQWLRLHLFISIIHVCLSVVFVLKKYRLYAFLKWVHELRNSLIQVMTYPLLKLTIYIDWIHIWSHLFFCLVILPNLGNFGDKSRQKALLINGLPLILSNLAYLFKKPTGYWRLFYFSQITSPIWFEWILYLAATFFDFYL